MNQPTVSPQRPLVVHARPALDLDDERFFDFCRQNDELRIEREACGDLVIMEPAGGGTGARNLVLSTLLGAWARERVDGRAFDSSTGYRLSNGAVRAPDASWVCRSRLDELTDREWERFLPLAPDFAAELRSPSDSLERLQVKMEEYLRCGTRLGWLLDPEEETVWVYRHPGTPERLANLPSDSGEPVLSGFSIHPEEIWRAGRRG